MTEHEKLVTPQEVAKAALRIDWLDTESAARRVAEHAAEALTLANARIARLEEALKPFANYADAVEGNLRSHGVACTPDYRKAVFVEDFRRARAALKGGA